MFTGRILGISIAVTSFALLGAACSAGDDDDEVTTVTATSEAAAGATQSGSATQPPRSSSTTAAALPAVHVCELITAEEVSAAVGFTVGNPRDYLAAAAGATQCEWTGTGVIYAAVLTKGGASYFKAVHIPNAALPEVEIPGLGDKALYSQDMNTVDVVSGDTYISVQLIGVRSRGVDEQTAGAALAKAILAKLK